MNLLPWTIPLDNRQWRKNFRLGKTGSRLVFTLQQNSNQTRTTPTSLGVPVSRLPRTPRRLGGSPRGDEPPWDLRARLMCPFRSRPPPLMWDPRPPLQPTVKQTKQKNTLQEFPHLVRDKGKNPTLEKRSSQPKLGDAVFPWKKRVLDQTHEIDLPPKVLEKGQWKVKYQSFKHFDLLISFALFLMSRKYKYQELHVQKQIPKTTHVSLWPTHSKESPQRSAVAGRPRWNYAFDMQCFLWTEEQAGRPLPVAVGGVYLGATVSCYSTCPGSQRVPVSQAVPVYTRCTRTDSRIFTWWVLRGLWTDTDTCIPDGPS